MKKTIFTVLIMVIFNIFTYSQINVEHLQLWLSADSVEIIGGKVARWYDLSPNSHIILQSTEANRPTKVDNTLNSEPVISFNGTTTYLDGGDILNLSTNNNMIFFVAKGSRAVMSKSRAADAANRYSFILGTNNFLTVYQDNILRNFTFTNASFNNQQYNLFTILNNRHLSKNIFYINSDSIGQSTILGSQNFTSSYNFLVGAYNNASGSVPPLTHATYGYLNGSIAEIIVVDTVSNQLKSEIENYLFDKYSPCFNLPDTLQIDYGFCDTAMIINGAFYDYIWSTGETTNSILVDQTGIYSVMARDSLFGRFCYDTTFVKFPSPNIQNNSNCLDDSVLVETSLVGVYDYLWSDLNTVSSRYFKDAGDYWLRMEDTFGCFDTVFFSVEVDSFKNNISLGNDTSLCSGNTITLIDGAELCSSFLWSTNGNTNPTQTVNETGWQKIEVENANGCSATDSIYVTIVGTAPVPGYIVENLCFGDTTQFIDNSTPQADISTWKWIINENDTLYTQNAVWVFESVGTQNIQLFVESLAGCTNSVDFDIEILDVPEVSYNYSSVCVGTQMIFIPEVIPPSANTVTSYSWLLDGFEISNEENLEYVFEEAGLYEIVFTSTISNGCSSSYVSEVSVLDSYPIAGAFTLVSPHDCYYYSKNEVLEFQWNNSIDAVSYKILLSGDQNFQENIYSQSNLDTNQITIPLSSLIDTIYWQVQSVNPCGVITSSDVRKLILFDYSAIANVSLWLAADSTDAVLNKVSKWYDLSPNMFEILQDNDNFKPVISDNALRNKPVIDFDGVDDYLDGGDILDLGINSHTFIFIAKGQKSIFAKSKASGDPNRYAFLLNLNRMEHLYQDNLLRSYVYNDISFNNNSFNFYKIVNQRNTSENKYYLNNNLLGAVPINGTYNFSSEYNFLIGAYNNSSGSIPPYVSSTYGYLDGAIAELIIIDSLLTESDYSLICNYLRDKYSNPVNLLYDIRIPYGFCDTAITTAYKPWFTSYEWSTGETDSIIHVNRPGVYSVTVTDIFGFESSDDIRVFYPEVNDFADTTVCFGNSVLWDAELVGDYSFTWYGSSETTQQINIDSPGDYAVIVSDTLGCQYLSDTISFSFDNYEFTASVGPEDTTLCAGNRLMLISNAAETVGWEWSTGSTNSEITLSSTGEYTVTTTNWRGCQAVDTINVTINGTVPVPNFESLGHCAQNPVFFTDLSTSSEGTINSWTWSINGEIFSTEQNPSWVSGVEPSELAVQLTISTDANCSDFITQDLTIYPLPKVSFTPQLVCQNTAVEFTSTSTVSGGTIINDIWEFLPQSKVTERSRSHRPPTTDHRLPTTDHRLPTNRPTDQPINWSTEKVTERSRSHRSTTTHTFTTPGYHTVQLTSTTDAGCVDSAEFEVYVKPAELPQFSAENTCLGEPVYFINQTPYNPVSLISEINWNFGDGESSSISSPQHIFEDAGLHDIGLTINYSNGCILGTTQEIEVYHKPEVEIVSLSACEGSAFALVPQASVESGNIATYNWQLGDPVFFESDQDSPDLGIADAGNYPISLEVSSDLGCNTLVSDTLRVHVAPESDFTASRTWGAVPLWVDFTNTSLGAEAYTWSVNNEQFSSDENPYFVFQDSGLFVVELTSYNEFGCHDISTLTIKSVIPVMDIILYSLRTVVEGDYLKTSVYIINNGTLPVDQLNLDLNLGSGKIYRETIENFEPSQVMDYTFTFKPYLASGELPELVCVEAVDPTYGIYTDINYENNTVCNTNVQNLLVFCPYPNPASNQIICEFITAKTEDLTITLINGIGKVVYQNAYPNHIGYQKTLIDVSTFSQGVYYLQVRTGEEMQNFKIEVNL